MISFLQNASSLNLRQIDGFRYQLSGRVESEFRFENPTPNRTVTVLMADKNDRAREMNSSLPSYNNKISSVVFFTTK